MHTNKFPLPQGIVTFSYTLSEHIYTLITGGRPPAVDWLQEALCGKLWAIDHGIDLCYAMNRIPDFLLGDGDSAAPAAWDWALTAGVETERFHVKKDLTDTQIALAKIKATSPDAFLLLTGAFGGRFDHAISTLFSCAFSNIPMILADEKEACFFLHGKDRLTFQAAKKPKALSLLSLTAECRGISVTGTEWQLENAVLRSDAPYAVSNELAADSSSFSVRLKEGTLAVYLYWQ